MNLTRAGILSPVLLLGACGPSSEYFAQQCQHIARVEVQNRTLWRAYLRERKQELAQSKVTVNDNEIDATDIFPVVFTKSFTSTNDWVRRGRPDVPNNEFYKNDVYIVHSASGKPIAQFRSLSASVPSFGHTASWSCISDYPHLYTGARPHRGSIQTSSR